ncbi:hypothetical protein F4604DRAFT_1925962 [Suillus subluteus]|nr:hypothetical protein F4604DRAFT_1925962 [Suillus subluteus]
MTRFHHRGDDEDLDEATALQRELLALFPVSHTFWSMSLSNLAIQLSICFDHQSNADDLDEATALQRGSLALLPVGNDEDLDEAIALHREALALYPVGHTDWSMSLSNLANQLFVHFHCQGNDEDLDEAIVLQRDALALHPVGHIFWPTNDEDLDEAIALHREALALYPVGQLSICFNHRGNDEDLNQAIALQREALALCLVGHRYRSGSLSNLAHQLSTCFDRRGNREDLDESRENLHCALTLLTQHDPFQVNVPVSLTTTYLSFHCSGLDSTGAGKDSNSLNAAMHHFKAAANVVSAGLLPRLRVSLHWVRHARQHSHDTQLEAYATSMQLLDAYMSMTASVSSCHNAMKAFPSTLAIDAASCALHGGDVRHAVELLEQGRTIIWTQMTQLHTPLDSLQIHSDHAAALMKRFRDLSSLLDKPPASYPEGTSRVNVEAEETRYRCLVEDWNGVVEEIQKIEGFSRFLLPPLYFDLQDAARDGPIIVLIASMSSCDAIIIPHNQPPTGIQLPTNWEKLLRLVHALQEAVEKDASPKGNQSALIKALRELWDDVVRLVVKNLGRFA